MNLALFARHADFRHLAIGSAWHSASFLGEQVLVGLLVYKLTGSSVWVGIAYALAFAPMLVVGLPAGLSADRFDRRRMLPRIEGCALALMGSMALALTYGFESVGLVLVATTLSGTIRALHHPLRLTYAHDLMGGERLVSALSALGVVSRTGQLAGALLAGWIAEEVGANAAYAALMAMHVVAVIEFMRLKTSVQTADTGEETLGEAIRDYLYELRTNPTLWRLTALASVVEIFGFSFATALPELASEQLGTGADGLGMLHAARSAGGLVASAALVWIGNPRRSGATFIGLIIGFGVAVMLLAVSPSLPLAMVAVGLVASCAASTDVMVQALMQWSVSERLRGRAMGAWVLALGAGPIGHLQVGALAGILGAGATLMLNGALLLGIGLAAAVFARSIRRL